MKVSSHDIYTNYLNNNVSPHDWSRQHLIDSGLDYDKWIVETQEGKEWHER